MQNNLENIREYNPIDVAAFRKTTEKYGGLSNMAAGFSLNINGIIIPTAEHLYQACKYPLFPGIQEEILCENSPMTAKMISRKYQKFVRQDWDDIRIKIMRWVLKVKLTQNYAKFSDTLRETENKPIVELSHKDKIWGAVEHSGKFVGVNALGRLLMELRAEIINRHYQRCIEPPAITGFLLFGHEIGLVCDDPFLEEYSLSFEKEIYEFC